MAQETQIKVKIDDNEALQALREMAALVESISENLSGLSVPPGAIPTAPQAPAPAPSAAPDEDKEDREQLSRRQQEVRRILRTEARATIDAVTSEISLGSLTSRVGDQLSSIARLMPKFFGISSGLPVKIAGEAMKATARSIQARQARLGEVIGLEAQETEIAGMIDLPDAKAFSEERAQRLQALGLDPSAARQLISGVAGAVGFRSRGADFSGDRLMSLAAAERSGVSAGGISALAGIIAQNTGMRVGRALDESLSLRNIAENQLDLRGPGVDSFLSGVGGVIDALTASGQNVAPSQIARGITGIARTTGQRGMRPTQIFQSLQGVGRGAFSQISAPLQDLAQMSVVADIYSRSGSLFEAMQNAEALQANAELIPDIIGRGLGRGEAGMGALAAIPGVGTRDARKLIRGVSGGTLQTQARRTTATVAAGLTLGAAQAAQQGKTIRSLRDDPKDTEIFQKMIEISGQSERNVLKMSENVQALTKLTDTVLKLQGALAASVNKFNSVLSTLARLIP